MTILCDYFADECKYATRNIEKNITTNLHFKALIVPVGKLEWLGVVKEVLNSELLSAVLQHHLGCS